MKMKLNRLASKVLPAVAVLIGAPGVAFAGTWSLAGVPSSAPFGGGAASPVVQVQFAGDGVTTDAQTSISIPAGFTAVAAAANTGGCSVDGTGTFINVTSSTGSIIAAGPTTFCNVTFTAGGATAAGNYDVTSSPAGGLPTLCFDGGGNPAPACAGHANGVGALRVVTISPAYSSTPAPGGTITITDPITPGATTATLTVTNTGDAGTTLNVQAPTGLSGVLSIAPNTAQAITQGSAGTTYTISCAATVDAPDSQTLSFVHDGSGAGAASPATYTVICDGSVANTPPTAALGAVVQPVAGSIGSTGTATVPVNVTGAGAPTGSLALTCTIPATGTSAFAVTAGGTRTFTAPATVGASSPDISVSCVRQAAAVTATLTCAQNATPDPDPAALTADITCPAGVPVPVASVSPSAISIVAAPSTPASGTATLSNTGTGQLDIASCTAPAGFTLTAPAAFPTSVAIGASTPLTVSCTTPAEGAPALTGNLTCQSNAPDAGGVITVPLSCSGTPLVVPAMDNMGKILLASLVIGLGLLGMALRRPA
jgi:hypothetical protein